MFLFAAVLLTAGDTLLAEDRPAVDFVRDIRPIFAEQCIGCHGAKLHEAELRMDTRKAFFAGGDSGKLIVPGGTVPQTG